MEYKIDDSRLRKLGWSPEQNFWKSIDELCDNDGVLVAE
jgi:hypothetical protein